MLQLYVFRRQVAYFLKSEVVPIAIVIGLVLPDAASLDSVIKLKDLALEIYKLFLKYRDSFYYVVSVKFVLYYNIY